VDERWQVMDELKVEGFRLSGPLHTFRLHWLLMDAEWAIETRESEIEIRIKSPQGWFTLHVEIQVPHLKPETSLVRAGELLKGQRAVLPFEGWVSPTYGVKVPALSLAVDVESVQTVRFMSEFIFPK
jgi:hypothetical protein